MTPAERRKAVIPGKPWPQREDGYVYFVTKLEKKEAGDALEDDEVWWSEDRCWRYTRQAGSSMAYGRAYRRKITQEDPEEL